MKVVAVMLRGLKENEYFEVDEWVTEKGVLTLMRYDAPGVIAAFPFENLLGVVDISSNAPVSAEELKEKLRAAAKASLTSES